MVIHLVINGNISIECFFSIFYYFIVGCVLSLFLPFSSLSLLSFLSISHPFSPHFTLHFFSNTLPQPVVLLHPSEGLPRRLECVRALTALREEGGLLHTQHRTAAGGRGGHPLGVVVRWMWMWMWRMWMWMWMWMRRMWMKLMVLMWWWW